MDGKQYQEAVKELYRAYSFFSKRFWKLDEDNTPIILVASRGRKSVYGWYWEGRWTSDEKGLKTSPEIVIAAESFDRGAEAVLETLLHEMAHHYNALAHIKDCTQTQYHNRAFKKAAEQLGLTVEKTKARGWSLTSLGDGAKAAIEDFKTKEELFKFKRIDNKKVGSKESKYINILLKREDFEGILRDLSEKNKDISYGEVVKQLLNGDIAVEG